MADLLARFESLNDDTLTTVLQFVGNKSYKAFGGLNKHCREIYLNAKGMTKETFFYGYAPLAVIIDKVNVAIERNTEEGEYDKLLLYPYPVAKGVVLYNRRDVFEWALEEQNYYLLTSICGVAASEGRIDLLNEVFNNVDDREDKESIFGVVDEFAALDGKLEVLKWLYPKGLVFNFCNECWCRAANQGHLHILKWLKEVKGLELDGGLYLEADGHLHVIKWLREQACPWSERTFICAAWWGNLEVLQYLHDEGCPWPEDNDDYRIGENYLKPEALNWLRTNGYGERIISFSH